MTRSPIRSRSDGRPAGTALAPDLPDAHWSRPFVNPSDEVVPGRLHSVVLGRRRTLRSMVPPIVHTLVGALAISLATAVGSGPAMAVAQDAYHRASACLRRRDYPCIVDSLPTPAEPREYDLLVLALRAMGRDAEMCARMREFIVRFPTTPQADRYRAVLLARAELERAHAERERARIAGDGQK